MVIRLVENQYITRLTILNYNGLASAALCFIARVQYNTGN